MRDPADTNAWNKRVLFGNLLLITLTDKRAANMRHEAGLFSANVWQEFMVRNFDGGSSTAPYQPLLARPVEVVQQQQRAPDEQIVQPQQQLVQQQQQMPAQQVAQQPQQHPARFDLRAINTGIPAVVQTVVRRKKGKIESLCDEVVKLANSMRSNTTSDEVFNNILVTVLTEKVVSSKLDRSTVDRMIEFLTSTTEEQTLNFQQAKINLRKEYVDHAFTENQRKVIDDLANLEVNRTTCDDQIDFALYYEKYVKMMLKYHFASNNRSRYAVKMVVNVLIDQQYDAVGLATKLPVTHDRKARIKALAMQIGVFCLSVLIVSVMMVWWIVPSKACPDYVQSANVTVSNSTVE